APQRARCPRCSSASQLLLRGVTSHDRASSATVPHLPDTGQSARTTWLLANREISRFPIKKRTIAVGTQVPPRPPHRSVRARLRFYGGDEAIPPVGGLLTHRWHPSALSKTHSDGAPDAQAEAT